MAFPILNTADKILLEAVIARFFCNDPLLFLLPSLTFAPNLLTPDDRSRPPSTIRSRVSSSRFTSFSHWDVQRLTPLFRPICLVLLRLFLTRVSPKPSNAREQLHSEGSRPFPGERKKFPPDFQIIGSIPLVCLDNFALKRFGGLPPTREIMIVSPFFCPVPNLRRRFFEKFLSENFLPSVPRPLDLFLLSPLQKRTTPSRFSPIAPDDPPSTLFLTHTTCPPLSFEIPPSSEFPNSEVPPARVDV